MNAAQPPAVKDDEQKASELEEQYKQILPSDCEEDRVREKPTHSLKQRPFQKIVPSYATGESSAYANAL